jgi:peptidoglycan/xylan/chitin deacetylase (PgdA/CDA1 family)
MSPGHTSNVSASHMSRAERRTLIVAAAVTLACVIALGLIAAAWAALPHQVTLNVNGRVVHVPSGSSVGDVVRMGYFSGARGDVLSVAGGVAQLGKGGEPAVSRNGRLTSPGQPVYDGDILLSTRGQDVVERTVVATEQIPPATRYIGEGALMTVSKPGAPGVLKVVKGQYSGSVVASEVVVPAEASVIVRRSPRLGKKVVALTFDDGPWPGSTAKIVSILQKQDVPATFFMVGVTATKRPAIARLVAKAGMVVGSHSFSHKNLDRLPSKMVHREVVFGVRRVGQITKTKPRWFRSPYGLTDTEVLKEVRSADLRIAGWTVDSRDWTRPGVKKIVRNVVYNARPGSIILMHDGGGNRAQTVAALPYIIKGLRARGYTFVTLDQLAAMSR